MRSSNYDDVYLWIEAMASFIELWDDWVPSFEMLFEDYDNEPEGEPFRSYTGFLSNSTAPANGVVVKPAAISRWQAY